MEETILARVIRETAARAREGDLPDPEEWRSSTPGRAFRAALDGARLDLAGVLDGAPVPVNGTIGFAGPREGAQAALQAIEAGFTTLKLKAGAERETEDLVARVRAIRQAVGPDVRLRVDVNGAWDLPTAEDRLDAIARFAIEYVELPFPADDTAGAAELRRHTRVPIAADEAVYAPVAALRLLAEEAVDVLVVKPARVGGPVAVAEIAAAAREAGVPVVLSTLFETGIGIAAARACAGGLPGGLAHGLATAGFLEDDLLVEPLAVDGGRMIPPGGAGTGGLGILLDDGRCDASRSRPWKPPSDRGPEPAARDPAPRRRATPGARDPRRRRRPLLRRPGPGCGRRGRGAPGIGRRPRRPGRAARRAVGRGDRAPGRDVCLEIARPRSRLARIMRWWFDRIVPLIGRSPARGAPMPTSCAASRATRPRSGSPR